MGSETKNVGEMKQKKNLQKDSSFTKKLYLDSLGNYPLFQFNISNQLQNLLINQTHLISPTLIVAQNQFIRKTQVNI